MHGKVVLVTGATGGIGFFTALGLASRGARVIITGRDAERGLRAQAELRHRAGHDAVEFWQVDHARLGENRALGRAIAERWGRLDVLVNNAGGIFADADADDGSLAPPAGPDGYELNLALNFLAPFALTDALLPLMLETGPGRIINVVARARHPGDPLENGGEPRGLSAFEAYARAKLLNLLWTMGLARDLAGSHIVVNAVAPAIAWTPGIERASSVAARRWRYMSRLVRWFLRGRSAEAAARPSIVASAEPEYGHVSGFFFRSSGRPESPPALALDAHRQEYARSLGLRLVACAATRPADEPAPRPLLV